MQERRTQPRRRALKTARIVFNNRFSVIDCTVRNLSDQGAMLTVPGPRGIPDSFVLEAGEMQRPCTVIWRKERQLGVTFG